MLPLWVPLAYGAGVVLGSLYYGQNDQNYSEFIGGAGKLWSSPTTAWGTLYGGLGLVINAFAGRPSNVRLHNNALEFYNHPMQSYQGAGITLGNVICYENMNPNKTTKDHERNHTYQAELLGPAYLPAHVLFGGYSLGRYMMNDPFVSVNEGWHKYNVLEHGPSKQNNPTPFEMNKLNIVLILISLINVGCTIPYWIKYDYIMSEAEVTCFSRVILSHPNAYEMNFGLGTEVQYNDFYKGEELNFALKKEVKF